MLIAVLVTVALWPAGEVSAQANAPAWGRDDTERISFLHSLGYDVSGSSGEVREVLIPDEFDEVFTQYNTLQKSAGMDLEAYKGRRMKCWTYEVVNDPSGECVLAHLYVYKDKIVGGDVSSTALDGFMRGLTAMPAAS